MRSSYFENVSYLDLIKVVGHVERPATVVEFGILDGASLSVFADVANKVFAFDIFEEFEGNRPREDKLRASFEHQENVVISEGDFYTKHSEFGNGSIDILHVDISNTGDVYEFCFEHYLKKVKDGGLIILEGGSKERDNVEWMRKYDKRSITHVLEEFSHLRPVTVGLVPSITLIRVSHGAT